MEIPSVPAERFGNLKSFTEMTWPSFMAFYAIFNYFAKLTH